MYSKNDYRYYLEHQLLTSGGYLAHHGVLGMKWGIRRYQSYDTVPRKSGEGGKETGLAKKKTRLENKKASNSAKIKKYQTELARPKTMKQKAKEEKYKAKLSKINSQWITQKAEQAERRHEHIGAWGEIKLNQKRKYERKLAKSKATSDKLNAKISQLEYKNAKLDKKIDKTDRKMEIAAINAKRIEAKKKVSDTYNNQDSNNRWMSKNDLKVNQRIIDSEYDKDVRAVKNRGTKKQKRVDAINAQRNDAKKKLTDTYNNQDPNNRWFTKDELDLNLALIDSQYDKDVRKAQRRIGR